MTPKLLLRISAVLMFIHAFFHTAGHLRWKEITTPSYAEVVKQMTVPKFPFMGATHSIGDYFDGYGYLITAFIILIGCLLWALSDIATKYPPIGFKTTDPDHYFYYPAVFRCHYFFFPLAAIYSGACSFLCSFAVIKLNQVHLQEVGIPVK